MSTLDPQDQPSPAGEARCTPDERRVVNGHAGKKVLVNGKPAIISPSIPISGDPSDRIRVTFPPDPSKLPDVPPELQQIIDNLEFTPID
jgi:hypothetical protein